jgi:glycosyltransferase involved in cell wall biosynthesis
MAFMKFSIVTISFNQARFLEQAILSIISQDYPNIQYIVVDPGSTDGSRDIIEKYHNHIDKIIFEPDNGPADGLNKGFRAATGQIYGFLNSDDFLLSSAISTVAKVFEKRLDIDVLSGHGLIVDEDNKIKKKIYSHRFSPVAYVNGACVLVQQSTFFKENIFWGAGGFNCNNRVSWDGELWLDIALNGGKFTRINRFLSAFRLYSDSISGSGNYLNEIMKQNERICEKIGVKRPSIFSKRVTHLINRITDPSITSRRIYDALSRNKYVNK